MASHESQNNIVLFFFSRTKNDFDLICTQIKNKNKILKIESMFKNQIHVGTP